jgi:hypothetical protein
MPSSLLGHIMLSVEDAIATIEVYRNAEVDIDREQGK